MKIKKRHLIVVLLLCIGLLIIYFAARCYQFSFAGLSDPKYAVIWSGISGAIIAAVISLIGVSLANKNSRHQLNSQHKYDKAEAIEQRKHDAEQKDEDRKAAIRREVYTKAVEEAHAVIAAISGMPEWPLNSNGANDADALQLFLKSNAKVWLVAESKAARLSRELTSLMGELYMLDY